MRTAQRFVQPDYSDSTQTGTTYPTNIDKAISVLSRLAAWFNPHQVYSGSPNPDMAVELDEGYIWNGSSLTYVAAQFVSGFATPAAGTHRVDRVVVDSTTGVASVVTGTPATGSPSALAPDIPENKIPICRVLLTDSDSVIVNSMITDERALVTSPASSKVTVPVRQTVLTAANDSNGYASFLSAGSPSALKYDVSASSTSPLRIAFAAGYDSKGAVDYVSELTTSAIEQGALAASNTNFCYATYVSASSVTWSNCLVPPQYGYAFDRTAGAILNFEAADATTTMVDDFGNTWTANGNAQIDTAQFKFGTASLLLDGTGDYLTNTSITTLGDGSWTIEGFFRWATLPAGTNEQTLFDFGQTASRFGAMLTLYWNSGTPQLYLRLSSNGTGVDIANAGANIGSTPVTGTWYHVALVYDALAGKYFTYWNGTKIGEVTSASRICALTRNYLGHDGDGSLGDMNGWVDGFRVLRGACLYPNGTTFTPPASAPSITDHKVHFFSLPEMKMYEVTTASSTAGVNPTTVTVNRVFVGEVDTNAVGITAARSYAALGAALGAETALNTSTVNTFAAKIGVDPKLIETRVVLINAIAEQGWQPGQVMHQSVSYNGTNGYYIPMTANPVDRNTIKFVTGAQFGYQNLAAGTNHTITVANWKFQIQAWRKF